MHPPDSLSLVGGGSFGMPSMISSRGARPTQRIKRAAAVAAALRAVAGVVVLLLIVIVLL